MPAIFGHAAWNQGLIGELLIAFLGFSLLSSAVYLQNDLADREEDALHPEKCKRPIASGALSIRAAMSTALLLFLLGSGTLIFLSFNHFLIGLAYVAMNILYTWVVKHLVLLDVLFLVQGYWLRLILGSQISGLWLSYWVLGVVALLAIYLILFKRLGDVQIYQHSGKILRKTVLHYASLPLKVILDVLASLIGLSFLAYIVVVFHLTSMHFTPWVYVCVPLVWIALFRYHRRMRAAPMIDPLMMVFRDLSILLPILFAFAILCLSLYFL